MIFWSIRENKTLAVSSGDKEMAEDKSASGKRDRPSTGKAILFLVFNIINE
jgi:hypothetical protein